jgi:hypothetical protein
VIRLSLSVDHTLVIESPGVTLRGLLPVLNLLRAPLGKHWIQPVRYVPKAEDVVLVQVRRPADIGSPGKIFFLNTGSRTVQRMYFLTDLGITDSVYLYNWENQSSSEELVQELQ